MAKLENVQISLPLKNMTELENKKDLSKKYIMNIRGNSNNMKMLHFNLRISQSATNEMLMEGSL